MKKILIVSIISLFALLSNAQHNEKSVGFSIGFLRYKGSHAPSYSFINGNSNDPTQNYTNDPFGRFSKQGPGGYLSFRHFAKSNWLWGLCLRAELLKNKVKLLNLYTSSTNNMYEGSAVFTSKSANIALNTGYRVKINRTMFIDLSPNLEFCYFLSNIHEKGFARYTSNNQTISTKRERTKPKFDIRTGIQADAKWHNYILSLGYSIGHWNAYDGYIGGNPEAYSRLFRIGVGYCLKK